MDFLINEEQQAFAGLAREILGDLVTHARLVELETRQPGAVFDDSLWRRMAAAGLVGIALPEEHGGGGLGMVELGLLLEECGRAVAPVPALTLALAALPIARFGTPEQRHALLPGVAGADLIVTAALEEPGWTAVDGPATTAARAGTGWTLSGEKAMVPYGAQAHRVLVPASTEDGDLLVFLVDPRAPGVTVTPLDTTNRAPHAALRLHEVTLDGSDVLGPDGRAVVRFAEQHGLAALCRIEAGVCAEALRMTARYTSERRQFDKPIASFQAVGQRAGDAFIDAEIVRLTSLAAAWQLAAGVRADESVRVAKFWAADGGSRVVHACQHLHGGVGVDLDYPLHRYFLWSKQIEHTLGTPIRQLLTLGAHVAATPV